MAVHAHRLLRLLTAVCVLLCVAWAMPASAAEPLKRALLPCVKLVTPGEAAASVARNGSGFDCTTPQNKLPPGDYWVRLDARGSATETHEPLILRTTSVWVDGHQINAFYGNGKSLSYDVPRHETASYLHLGALLEFPLGNEAAALETIVVRIDNAANARGIMLAPQLINMRTSTRDERDLAAFYAAFAGLCIALLVYNLALWRGMRSPFQLAYGAMVVSLLGYAFTSSGFAAYVFPTLLNQDRLRINYVLLALAAATALVFLRHFLEDHILPRWFVRAMWVQAFLVVIVAAIFALCAPRAIRMLDLAYFISFMPMTGFFAATLYFGLRNKSRYVGYMILAWTAPVGVSFVRGLHGIGVLSYNFYLDNASLAAMALEAMISSMAIGQRIRTITRDRDHAKAAERIANALADKDPLTGLLNRRAFVRELLEAPRDWQLVLVDIDHFKRVNDTLGHVGGDDVLVKIAAALQAKAPDGAMVARLGGEEFAIATLAPFDGQGLADAPALLDAVRSAEMPGGYRVTASIGVARRVICEEMDWKILYRAADMALYRAKAEGRDRHVDYSAERIAA